MAEKSGLFNSVSGAPAYNDIDIANMLSLLTGGQGYIKGRDNELIVSAGAGLEVLIDTGGAWIGEPNGWWYLNDTRKSLTIDQEVVGFERIDRVVLRLNRDISALSVTTQILKGNATASNPVAPELTQNSIVYELSLAQVHVIGGETTITVTDERNSVYCGAIRRLDSGNVVETTPFTLGLKHINCFVLVTSDTDVTITIPLDANTFIPINTDITIAQHGVGQITYIPEVGVDVKSVDGNLKSDGRYSAVTLRKYAENGWYAIGALTT